MKSQYGVDSMPETGENVAEEFQVSRADQDAFALRSQQRAAKAIAAGYFAEEIVPVEIAGRKGEMTKVDKDEHPRETTLEALAKLKTPFRKDGTVTAGNASGVNDGAAALIDRLRAGGEGAWPDAARTHARHGIGGGAAAHHGHRPGAGDPQADGAPAAQNRRLRCDRDQ